MSFIKSRWMDVGWVAGARAVSVCGDFLAATTLALVLQQAGHGGWVVSGLFLAAGLPLAVLAPVAGRIADRADSRTVLVVAGFGQAAVCVALAYVSGPPAIIALTGVLACGLAITQPTLQALLPGMVRPSDLPRASGLVQTASQAGMLAAPALAGVLVGLTGARVPLLIDAASYLALVAAGLLVRTRRRNGVFAGGSAAPAEREHRGGWRLRDDRALAVMVLAFAATVGAVAAVNVAEVFFLRETLRASTTMFGLVAASWTAGMMLGAVAFGRLPRERITPRGLLVLTGLTCVPVAVAAAVPDAGWMIPLWVLGGISNGGISVFTLVIISSRVPGVSHGRAFAAMSAAVQAASLAGVLAAGPLVELVSPRLLIAAAGTLGVATALVAISVLVRRSRERPVAAGRSRSARLSSAARHDRR